MKKLMIACACACILAGTVGCGMFSSDSVKIEKSQYVRNGTVKSFTPDTAMGGYIVGVTLGKDVTKQVFTNSVQSQSFSGKAYLLVGMDETATTK